MMISATVITLNEEEHVGRCLESAQGVADEVILVDGGSRDQTRTIAARLGARVFKRDWKNYSDQKNFAASQASHDWILSLDADECLSDRLRRQLLAVKANPAKAAAYEFPRRTFYLGRWIRHCGWYPDHKIRLYRRQQGQWKGDFVHEHLSCDGPVVRLEGDLLHYTCDSVADHACRVGKYTTLAAQDLQRRGTGSGPLKIVGSPVAAFLSSYFLKAGFLDGFQGLLISAFAAYYNFLKYSKLWDLQRSPPPGQAAGEEPGGGCRRLESGRD
jgi:glycosyltransferase involved in cell wall biosynthesis